MTLDWIENQLKYSHWFARSYLGIIGIDNSYFCIIVAGFYKLHCKSIGRAKNMEKDFLNVVGQIVILPQEKKKVYYYTGKILIPDTCLLLAVSQVTTQWQFIFSWYR